MTAKPKVKKEQSREDNFSFEDSLQRLEEIVETIESGKTPLDEVMKMYEEGVRLSSRCLEHLSQAELKLKRLGKDLEGNFELFDQKMGE